MAWKRKMSVWVFYVLSSIFYNFWQDDSSKSAEEEEDWQKIKEAADVVKDEVESKFPAENGNNQVASP